jgi:hypothetical protein
MKKWMDIVLGFVFTLAVALLLRASLPPRAQAQVAPTGAGIEPAVVNYEVPGISVPDGLGGTMTMDYFSIQADGAFMGVVYDWQILSVNRYGDEIWTTIQTFTAPQSGTVGGSFAIVPGSTGVFRLKPHTPPSNTFLLKWNAPIITVMVGSPDDPFTFVPYQLQTSGQTWAVYRKTDLSGAPWVLLGTTTNTSFVVGGTLPQAYFTVLSTNAITQ